MAKNSGLQKHKTLLPVQPPIRVYSFAEFERFKEEERIRTKVNAVAYPKKKIF